MCGRMDSAFSRQSSTVKSVSEIDERSSGVSELQPATRQSPSLQPSQKHITRRLYRYICTQVGGSVARNRKIVNINPSIDTHAVCLSVCLRSAAGSPALGKKEDRSCSACVGGWAWHHPAQPDSNKDTYIHRVQISPSLAPLCNGSLAEPPTYLPNRELVLVSRLGGPKNRHRRRRRQVVQSRTIRWLHRHARRCEDGCLHVPLPPSLCLSVCVCQACRT